MNATKKGFTSDLIKLVSMRLFSSYSAKPYHRFYVLLMDCLIVFFSFAVSVFMRIFFKNCTLEWDFVILQGITIMTVFLLSFIVSRSYVGLIRYAGFGDMRRLLRASVIAFVLFALLNVLCNAEVVSKNLYFLPSYYVIFSVVSLTFFLLCLSRFIIRRIYNEYFRLQKKPINVMVYGAGEAGLIVLELFRRGSVMGTYKVICFVDDAKKKAGTYIDTIPVYRPGIVMNKRFLTRNNIEEMIVAIPSASLKVRQAIINMGLDLGLRVKSVPHISTWINNDLEYSQIEEIKIEDLLGRDAIILGKEDVRNDVQGKVVMVTGAAGSIGSEICRQLMHYGPSRLVMLDQGETPMYDLQYELCKQKPYADMNIPLDFIVANVKDEGRMEDVFAHFNPQIVYHAAAYKHVPLMEDFPYEAVAVNVFGTKNVADLAVKYGAEKFVMISTDKAVNPTNVMGATKRIAEIYTQSRHDVKTKFITTRFGNVLGSNGSVIPLFKKQLEQGGPLTVTDKNITRYFMTIPEACSLVLEAAAKGDHGNIFVFDMGEPVKIYDLAKKMIALSHMPEVEIKITGLRPGEKLYEELLATKENTIPTDDLKIMRAKVREYEASEVDIQLSELKQLLLTFDDNAIVGEMKKIVPEFVSNNSVFSSLDQAK